MGAFWVGVRIGRGAGSPRLFGQRGGEERVGWGTFSQAAMKKGKNPKRRLQRILATLYPLAPKEGKKRTPGKPFPQPNRGRETPP